MKAVDKPNKIRKRMVTHAAVVSVSPGTVQAYRAMIPIAVREIPVMTGTKILAFKMKGTFTGLPLHSTFSSALRCLLSCDKEASTPPNARRFEGRLRFSCSAYSDND